MRKYPSIETVFVRNKDNQLDTTRLRSPEYGIVTPWSITEKVDGTNIRVTYTHEGKRIGGRTDKATLNSTIIEAVDLATPSLQEALDYFSVYRGGELHADWSVTFYGEAYGPGIQKGGTYSESKKFRAFDLLLGAENWWLNPEEFYAVCATLEIPTVPYLGNIDYIPTDRSGVIGILSTSLVAKEDSGQTTEPEGIVARPLHTLLDKHGDRVMWKLCLRDL